MIKIIKHSEGSYSDPIDNSTCDIVQFLNKKECEENELRPDYKRIGKTWLGDNGKSSWW